jgi:ABC-2 type transport system ATP-binding protein
VDAVINTTQKAVAQPVEPGADAAIRVRGLHRRYGSVEAVRGIDLEVGPGEIFAFLGPNGAGKTTTVEILAGLGDRTGGEVEVLGADPARADRAWRNRVGIVLQESRPEPGLTVRESLELYAGYYERPRDVDETIAAVGLEQKADALGERLSGGQRRRLDVAFALIGDPELIFLDEPTTGFDPSARRSAWRTIDRLRANGRTIFLTTHSLEEAERLADRIAVIARGRIVAEGTPDTLGRRDLLHSEIRFSMPGARARDLPPRLRRLARDDGYGHVVIHTPTPMQELLALGQWAPAAGRDVADLEVHRPSLEDVYLDLTTEHRKEG